MAAVFPFVLGHPGSFSPVTPLCVFSIPSYISTAVFWNCRMATLEMDVHLGNSLRNGSGLCLEPPLWVSHFSYNPVLINREQMPGSNSQISSHAPQKGQCCPCYCCAWAQRVVWQNRWPIQFLYGVKGNSSLRHCLWQWGLEVPGYPSLGKWTCEVVEVHVEQ